MGLAALTSVCVQDENRLKTIQKAILGNASKLKATCAEREREVVLAIQA